MVLTFIIRSESKVTYFSLNRWEDLAGPDVLAKTNPESSKLFLHRILLYTNENTLYIFWGNFKTKFKTKFQQKENVGRFLLLKKYI